MLFALVSMLFLQGVEEPIDTPLPGKDIQPLCPVSSEADGPFQTFLKVGEPTTFQGRNAIPISIFIKNNKNTFLRYHKMFGLFDSLVVKNADGGIEHPHAVGLYFVSGQLAVMGSRCELLGPLYVDMSSLPKGHYTVQLSRRLIVYGDPATYLLTSNVASFLI